jgi:hypothetical protein
LIWPLGVAGPLPKATVWPRGRLGVSKATLIALGGGSATPTRQTKIFNFFCFFFIWHLGVAGSSQGPPFGLGVAIWPPLGDGWEWPKPPHGPWGWPNQNLATKGRSHQIWPSKWGIIFFQIMRQTPPKAEATPNDP